MSEVFALPLEFEEDDIETYIDFWQTFGTHVLKKGSFGGRIAGVVLADKCAVDGTYPDVQTFGACLTQQFQSGKSGCNVLDLYDIFNSSIDEFDTHETKVLSSSEASQFLKVRDIDVIGGDISTFQSLLTSFDNFNKDEAINSWINSLRDQEAIIGGSAQTIHHYLLNAVNSIQENNYFNKNNIIDTSSLKSLLTHQSNALRDAYEYYQDYLANETININCGYNCFQGKFNYRNMQM